jgi:hypothetical protein
MSTSSRTEAPHEFFKHEPYRLAEWKDDYLAIWAREMLRHPVLGPLNLTARQRRVIASLIWERKVAEGNKDSSARTDLQPPPVAGLDAKGRPVVQKIEGYGAGGKSLRMWSVGKEGQPLDIKEPVTSLRTGERVIPPAYARSEERW